MTTVRGILAALRADRLVAALLVLQTKRRVTGSEDLPGGADSVGRRPRRARRPTRGLRPRAELGVDGGGGRAKPPPRSRPRPRARLRRWAAARRMGTELRILSKTEDQYVLIELAAAMPEMIAEQLAGWGAQIDVIRPEGVREHLGRIDAELAERYGRASSADGREPA